MDNGFKSHSDEDADKQDTHKSHHSQSHKPEYGPELAEPISSADATSDDAQPRQLSNELEQRIGELTEALQRERADATNLRRRHAEELAGLKTHIKVEVVKQLLPIVDNLERALKHVPEDLVDNDYVKGVQGIVKQFEKTLGDIGVERIAALGQPFDPHYHDAVSVDEGEGGENAQEIVSDELQAGYKIGEDVVRPTMVRVKVQ